MACWFAGEISKNLGLLAPSELELLRAAVGLCGPLPPAADIDEQAIIENTSRDKKSVGGHVQWVLLERIGKARIVDGSMNPARTFAGFRYARPSLGIEKWNEHYSRQ